MRSPSKQAAQEFGARLRELMKQRGYTSKVAAHGVDVGVLAKAAGATYEMARRYASGEAVPRTDKLAAIAGWLGVKPSELVYGAAAPAATIDEGLLKQCIQAVQDAQRRTGQELSTERAAHLVAVLYQEAATGQLPGPQAIDLLAKAVA